MNKLLLTLTILVLGVIGLTSISYATNKPDLEDKPCPAGTYKIAEGICKKEPTGCHLDENTPLDECKTDELPPAPVAAPQETVPVQQPSTLK